MFYSVVANQRQPQYMLYGVQLLYVFYRGRGGGVGGVSEASPTDVVALVQHTASPQQGTADMATRTTLLPLLLLSSSSHYSSCSARHCRLLPWYSTQQQPSEAKSITATAVQYTVQYQLSEAPPTAATGTAHDTRLLYSRAWCCCNKHNTQQQIQQQHPRVYTNLQLSPSLRRSPSAVLWPLRLFSALNYQW